PEDALRKEWQRAGPLTLLNNQTANPIRLRAGEPKENIPWYTYSSSYQLNPSAYLSDIIYHGANKPSSPYNQGAKHWNYRYGGAESLAERQISDVSFPAVKVAISDSQQRHHGRSDMYFA